MNFKGVAYRSHDPRWAWSPTSGEGAKLYGGRFNRIGLPALYLTLDYEVAIVETCQGFGGRMPPLTIVEYDIDVTPVADLRIADNYLGLSTWPVELDCEWLRLFREGKPVPTWDLADELITRSFVGALVPSFAPGVSPEARNLVLWTWGTDLPSRVVPFDPGGRLTPKP